MKRRKAYVIGTKVRTSLSPTIFKYWFKKYNIEGKYEYKEIKEDNFDNEIKLILKEDDLCGLNITIPFKEKIISHIPKINPIAIKIGAVNWLSKNSAGGFCGENSDWIGFGKSIKKFCSNINKDTAIIIGYGGVSKAILHCLISEQYKKIKLFNRSYEKINFNQTKHGINTYGLESLEKHIQGASLIINTTPVNVLSKKMEQNISPNTVGFDVVYIPRGGTGFLSHFKPKNRIEGIHMLVYQAIPCFTKWFGLVPEVDGGLFRELFKTVNEC